MLQQQHHGDKAQGRAAHGVGQIDPPGIPRLAVQRVHHQGQRRQGEQLIKEVHRQHIGGEGDAQGDPQAGQIESEEPVLASLPAHVLRRVQAGQGPQDRHQHGKDAGQSIHPEGDGQPLPQGQQLERLLPPQGEHRSQGRRRPGTGGADHKILAPPRVLGPPDQKDAPRRHGQQNGKQHQHSAFSLLSFLMRSLQK